MPPKSKQIATHRHVNIHELILDYMCCHHLPPKSNEMATDKHVNIHELILDYMCCQPRSAKHQAHLSLLEQL